MKLADKGHYASPPVLPYWAQRASEALASWPLVHARTHWRLGDETVVDGADFYVDDAELGHLHLDGVAHVAQSRILRDALIASSLASPLVWSADFVVFPVESAQSLEAALWIFRLRYDYLRGADASDLLERVRARKRILASGVDAEPAAVADRLPAHASHP